MSTTPTLASLIATVTTSQYFTKWLQILQGTGVQTESWQVGDPTRETGYAFSAILAEFDDGDNGFPNVIRGGLLGLAEGSWLALLTAQNYGTPKNFATFANCTMVLTNPTPKDFGSFDPEDVTFEDSATGATYRNTEAFTLNRTGGPNGVATFQVEAEIAGSGGNAGTSEIDTIVSPAMTGVLVGNTTAAVGQDDESDDALTARAQLKFGSVSPAGPRDAYEYSIETPSLQTDGSNTTNVTRVLAVEESDYGDALIFIAGAAGALSGADVTRAQDTIEKWANPLVVNGEVLNTTNVTIPVTYELWLYDSINLTNTQIQALIATALQTGFEARPIAGDKLTPGTSGFIYADWVKETIVQAVAPHAFKCVVTLPAGDVPLVFFYSSVDPTTSTAEVGVLGTIIVTAIHQIES